MTRCIQQALVHTKQQLSKYSSSAYLDAQLLVSMSTQRSRTALLTYPDYLLTPTEENHLNHFTQRRLSGEPMAYLLGEQEFWGLSLTVTPDVLIPRPETEHLVDWILNKYTHHDTLHVADLGTGSGAIALALASEHLHWQIDATDQSEAALAIAQNNAAQHGLNQVSFYRGDWFAALPEKKYHVIVSNPPYIADNDPHLHALTYEPQTALRSGHDGLAASRQIISQASQYLLPAGYLILEHGYQQAGSIEALLKENGFRKIHSHLDLAKQPRFTTAMA